jgi:hypothetical protein
MAVQQDGATAEIAAFVASSAVAPEPVLDAARQLWSEASGSAVSDQLLEALDGVAGDLLGLAPAETPYSVDVDAWPAPWRALRLAVEGHPPVAAAGRAIAGPAIDGAPDETVLDAIGHGLEVSTRIGETFAGSPSPWAVGAVAARFGAVATAGRLLKLDQPRLVQAFGLAGGQSGGLSAATGTVNERVQLGRAVFDGVEAVLLAQRGFTASDQIVEGVGGAGDVLFDVVDYETLTAGLSESWHCLELSASSRATPGRPAL